MQAFVTRSQLAAIAKLRSLSREFASGQRATFPVTADGHRQQADFLRRAGNEELAAQHDRLAAAIERRKRGVYGRLYRGGDADRIKQPLSARNFTSWK